MTNDSTQRFLFEKHAIRGEIVRLDASIDAMVDKQNYPQALAALLGESLAAASLMSSILKFDGRVSVQFQGQGPTSLLYAEATDKQKVKAYAKWTEACNGDSFKDLLSDGHLVVTIEPEGGKRYQGIVPLESDSLSACLEKYFELSEQLKTGLWIFVDGSCVNGLLLQQLPGHQDEDFWQHLTILADTLQAVDFTSWNNQNLLQRLFAEEDIRLFDAKPVEYVCGCSLERCERSLMTLPPEEVQTLLAECQGVIDMTCEVCKTVYQIDAVDVARLQGKHPNPGGGTGPH